MELVCPHCGAKNSGERPAACAACGESLGGRGAARRVREYDGYAVGRRLVRMAPLWLLLLLGGVVLVLLLLSRLPRPAADAGPPAVNDFRNEATNREHAREGGKVPVRHAAAAGNGAPGVAAPAPSPAAAGPADATDEADAFSVQVGAFADLSQANEQVSRLRAAGFEAKVVETLAATRFRFQVRSGRFASREEAAQHASRLHAAGVAAETVVVEPERK